MFAASGVTTSEQRWKSDQFFHPFITKIHIGPILFKTHSSEHSDPKTDIFQTHESEENRLCSRPVSVPATHSCEICEPVLPTLLHDGHKRTFKWSYR